MTDPNWLDGDQQRAWRGYRRMRLLLDARLARELTAESGLSMPDYDVLSTLSESEGHRRRISELADRMLWSKSRLSHHLTRMEQRGLVTRQVCATDGRAAVAVLTDAGLRTLQAAAPGHVDAVRAHFVDLLTAEQLAVFTEIAATVLANLGERPVSLADPTAGDQTAGDQTAGDQTAGDQTAGDQMAGDQMAGDQMAGDQMAGGSATDGSATDGPIADGPIADGPTADAPTAARPAPTAPEPNPPA